MQWNVHCNKLCAETLRLEYLSWIYYGGKILSKVHIAKKLLLQMFTLETSAGIDKRDLFLWDSVWTGHVVNLILREYIVNKKIHMMYVILESFVTSFV